MGRFAALPPLSLYVHLPWCEHKCPYCDFNSHALSGTLPETAYIEALLTDLEQDLPQVWGRPLCSIFIGGGTPSLFSGESIERLLSGIRALLPWTPEMEITLECNPGSAELEKFRDFHGAGVNRLSIGVQSFNSQHLEGLGRIHGRDEALAAARAATEAGFDNFNLDLMFGLPRQTLDEAIADAELAVAQGAGHLSCYQLTIEPNTLFHHHPPAVPDDDTTWEMQQAIRSLLTEHRYTQYEVSAYAREQRECRHNVNYWRFGDYLGIGAGAHAKITSADTIVRTTKTKHPRAYLRHAGGDARIAEHRQIDDSELPFEFMLNALRLRRPIDVRLFQQRTGLAITRIQTILEQAVADGLLSMTGTSISTTDRGFRFLNELLQRFLPDD